MIYEANGLNLQQDVQQVVFSPSSGKISFIDFTNIEYRITDATKIDKNSKFWSINYFWPGDEKKLTPGQDKILNNVKQGRSHSKSNQVERLIEFKIKTSGISISDTEPIQLVLEPDVSRNWEALARLDNKGLLIATDKYPKMILAYVAFE